MAGHRLVHGVVQDLGHQVVHGPLVGAADIHAGAAADGLQPLEDLDVLGAIIGGGAAGVFFKKIGHVGLRVVLGRPGGGWL